MPRSKRSKVVSLTKTDKKGREHKAEMITQIQANADKWQHVWVFSVGNMRNSALKDVRERWKGTGRMFFGRTAVMAKALGTTDAEEYKPGIHKLAQRIKGPVGIFFTDYSPQEVIDWFASYQKPDFARSGNVARKEVVLPAGPILQYNDPSSPFPSSMDPQLRKLGLTTKLVRGVPSLDVPHIICKKGDKLTSEQAQLLKLIGEQMATFKIRLIGRWCEADGWVEVEGEGAEGAEDGQGADDESADEEEMR
ncbi:hypothetical protein BOTBODRAFT_65689 [Botryobasidium botryosum FD-172 SS1]|uniref:Ribosome assembly factor mrt4 n=1 Tax=Botryobasidium botryosum (strain FD-172 SS1) TaxID=930990 RepID=A0A067MT26_BOTB1|nr:hypothetical protein BOTBODRAFT_65689 [Botryobasidium botryosum FD-172 SS1]